MALASAVSPIGVAVDPTSGKIVQLELDPRYGDYKYAINNSFGFGGHNVALAFGKY